MPRYRKGFVATPDGSRVPYVTIGDGPIARVVIPGAGDGLSLVTDAAANLAFHFRKAARRYRILVLSRRDPIPPGHSLEAHADDLAYAIESLGFGPCILECNSAGGPVGQILAARRPELVSGLVLSVTFHRSNPETGAVVSRWLELVDQGRWSDLLWNTMELTYRPKSLARYRLMKPLLPLLSSPARHADRLKNLLKELLDFDHRSYLSAIRCPVLVSGGEDDRIIPAGVTREMASLIPGATLRLYPGYGHGNDLENPAYGADFDGFVEGKC